MVHTVLKRLIWPIRRNFEAPKKLSMTGEKGLSSLETQNLASNTDRFLIFGGPSLVCSASDCDSELDSEFTRCGLGGSERELVVVCHLVSINPDNKNVVLAYH